MIEEVEKNIKFYGSRLDIEVFFPRESDFANTFSDLPDKELLTSSNGLIQRYKPEVIKYLLKNKDILENVLKVYENNPLAVVTLKAFKSDKISTRLCSYSVSDLFDYMVEEAKTLSDEEKEVAESYLKRIAKCVDPQGLLESQDSYGGTMGNKRISAKVSKLAKLFIEDNGKVLLGDFDSIDTDGLPIDEFLYIAKDWALSNNIFLKYSFSPDARNLLNELKSDNIVDFFGVDLVNETHNEFTKGIEINSDIIKAALSNMPLDYSDLKKAIYIYIKLCQTLAYDSGFYASSQKGRAVNFHSKPEVIPNVSASNNEVVCYEFAAIFGELLNKVGINYIFKNRYNHYGYGHANLMFKADNIVVDAEPLKSILDSDFTKARFDNIVNGLSCQNTNPKSREMLRKSILEVCDDIREQERESLRLQDEFEKWSSYYQTISHGVKVSLHDKMELVNNKMAEVYTGNALLDIVYLKRLVDVVFDQERCEGGFEMIIMGRAVESNKTDALPIALLAMNQEKGKDAEDSNKFRYVLFDVDKSFKIISKQELKKALQDQKFVFINEHRNIPGIREENALGGDDD